MKIVVGIDLGTTYSTVAHYDKDSCTTRVLNNSLNSEVTPSVVYIDHGKVLIGEEAKSYQESGDTNTASFYKSWMGNENFTMNIDGKSYSSEDLSSLFLKELVKDIEESNDIKIEAAVVTVPAYFNNAQRDATMRAATRAGIKVLKIIKEPTAAIISYGLSDAKDKNIAVYDLGGGTFDVTIANVKNGNVTVLGTDGDHQLGGKDWDLVIINHIVNEFMNDYGVNIKDFPDVMAELMVEAENVKKRLSMASHAVCKISCDGYQGSYDITREWFDFETQGLLIKTQLLVDSCLSDIQDKISMAGIDEFALVGGSTRMPQVREFIKNTFHKDPITNIDVDTVVARGAAIQAALCVESKITMTLAAGNFTKQGKRTFTLADNDIIDVTAHSMGMLSVSPSGDKYINSIIIPKNSNVPTTLSKPFKTRLNHKGEGLIEVYILQGENIEPLDNTVVGKYEITDIVKENSDDIIVDISYSYNKNGMIEVSAIQRSLNRRLKVKKAKMEDDYSWMGEAPKLKNDVMPTTVFMTYDTSGSMWGSFDEVVDAGLKFLSDINADFVQVGVSIFAEDFKTLLDPSHNKNKIEQAIKKIKNNESVGSGTSANPFNYLKRHVKDKSSKYIIIVLTDGEWLYPDAAIESAQQLKDMGVEIIAIGIAGASQSFLKQIASSENAGEKMDLNRVRDSFSSIAQAINEGDTNFRLG